MSEKLSLTGEQIVAGNIKDFKQIYEIFYYSKENKLVDKIALYIFLANKEKRYARRSIYFSSLPQLRHLIKDLVKSYFYFLDNRIQPAIPRNEYRIMMLGGLLDELKLMQIEEWKVFK